jgi:hypothetical protein
LQPRRLPEGGIFVPETAIRAQDHFEVNFLPCCYVARAIRYPDIESEVVIEGFLRIGEKLGITAGTKRFKTWLLLYIAY